MEGPTILPLDPHLTSFHLFFNIQGTELSFSVHGVPPPSMAGKQSLQNAKLECTQEVRAHFRGFENVLKQRLNQSMDIDSFALEVQDILERITRINPKLRLLPATFYTRLFSEIEEIGWKHVANLGDELLCPQFRLFDQVGREHMLEVKLLPEYPEAEPIPCAEFPMPMTSKWWSGATLKDVFLQFQMAVDSYQDFWNMLDEFDQRTWVIEPEHPSHADCSRRIALGCHCSLSITVDPLSPRSLPECRFFGSEMSVAPLRKKLNENIRNWRKDLSILKNLENVLESSFPGPQNGVHEDLSADCGICYAYRIQEGGLCGQTEGAVPDQVCDNANCGRPFHSSCLVEWLRSITTTRQSFNVLFGNCPYCSYPIAVKSFL